MEMCRLAPYNYLMLAMMILGSEATPLRHPGTSKKSSSQLLTTSSNHDTPSSFIRGVRISSPFKKCREACGEELSNCSMKPINHFSESLECIFVHKMSSDECYEEKLRRLQNKLKYCRRRQKEAFGVSRLRHLSGIWTFVLWNIRCDFMHLKEISVFEKIASSSVCSICFAFYNNFLPSYSIFLIPGISSH